MLRTASLLVIFFVAIAQPGLLAAEAPQTTAIPNIHVEKAKTISIDLATQEFKAAGDVRVTYDETSVEADEISGNAQTREVAAMNAVARMRALLLKGAELTTRRLPIPGPPGGYALVYVIDKGVFTTCDLEHPHYKITGRSISVEPGKRAVARRSSLWLGNFKLFTLPKLVIDLRPGDDSESFFPKPGIDDRDGLYLTIQHPLISREKLSADLDVRATTRGGIQGGVSSSLRIWGGPSATAARRLIDLRTRPVVFPLRDNSGLVCPESLTPRGLSSQLVLFGNYYHRRRVFDIDAEDLLVDSAPEIGLRWLLRPFPLWTTGVSAYVAGQLSWGDFNQVGFGGRHGRTDGRLTLSTMPIPFLAKTTIQPALYARFSRYDNGDEFQAKGASIDVTRAFGRAYLSGRALSHSTSGDTPFEFDDIDRFRELQGSLLYCGRREGMGLVLRYSLDRRNLYDWEFTYTRKMHCLQPTLTWQGRFGLFRIDVKVLGLE